MKTLLAILMVTLSLNSQGQDFSMQIDPGDFSNAQEVTTIYANFPNNLYIDSHSAVDTRILEIDNGKVLEGRWNSHAIIPDKIGYATVKATVKFNNGQIIERTKTYEVIDYPQLALRVKQNELLADGTIEFQIFSDNKNVTPEFSIGYFEIEILDQMGESLFQTPMGGSLRLNLKNYETSVKIQKGQTLKISAIRLLWEKYNLPASTSEFEIKID